WQDDLVRLEPPLVVGPVPSLWKAREALALPLGLRIESTFHLDANVVVAIPDELGRLRAKRAVNVALPEVVRLEQVSVAVDDALSLHDRVLPGMDPRLLEAVSSSRIR